MPATVRVDVADVQETHLDGRSGGIRAAVMVRGDFLVGTDLGLAAFEAVYLVAKYGELPGAAPADPHQPPAGP